MKPESAQQEMTNPHKSKAGLQRFWNTLQWSMAGLSATYRNEVAFRQEVFLPASHIGKALMIASILLVLMVELINSGIEAIVDRVSLEPHDLSKRAKDCGSAAVLVALVNVVIVWSLALWPHK
jgi:diacylglycerol kinase (ATP)